MKQTLSKTKLTLWIPMDIKEFGRWWTKRHHESISHLFSDYLRRLKGIDEIENRLTPIVKRISGIIKEKRLCKEDYKKYIEKKYLHA